MNVISERLAPDNIVSPTPEIEDRHGVLIQVIGPSPAVARQNGSICLGALTAGRDRWPEPMQDSLDGTYALFRSSERYVELATDVVATRTIWYYFDHDVFAASTSQRALVVLLGRFTLDEGVIPWMLSTGTLGPEGSWDTGLRRVRGDSTVRLDRLTWTVGTEQRPHRFAAASRAYGEHRASLEAALEESAASLNLGNARWVLALSGGWDSRCILCLLQRRGAVSTVTWGLAAAMQQRGSDAQVARRLAGFYRLPHEYYPLDRADEPIDRVVGRFLRLGEGRTDQLVGYTDGFALWRRLFENGVRGILRGDEGFGCASVRSDMAARHAAGLRVWSDFVNLRPLADFGLAEPEVPASLRRIPNETLEGWRDRMYYEFRMPMLLAALNDLKASYVEIVNPLISRRILDVVRQLPDALRTDKRLFKDVVKIMGPRVPIARRHAIDDPRHVLRNPPMATFLTEQLSSESNGLLPTALLQYIVAGLEGRNRQSLRGLRYNLTSAAKQYAPAWMKRRLRPALSPRMDFHLLALRAHVIGASARMLSEDARAR